jgi:L-ascorbate metabolism protein UlaG (beta-lactamase superfamily)
MKIKWLAHASFLITTDAGIRIITDPYKTDESVRHGEIKETADIVTVSHGHNDHANVAAVRGNPQVVRASGMFKNIKIRTVLTAHDDSGGSQRGTNIIFCLEVDGISICHCGDLGHLLTDAQVRDIGKVDVLMVPVGGFFTIDAAAATRVCEQLKPKIILPMHYKTDRIGLPITGVEAFVKGKDNVTRAEGSEIEVTADKLPESARIVLLKPAL